MRHEHARQMLGDEDRRADPARQRAQEFEQGMEPAGRGAERDAAQRRVAAWRAAGSAAHRARARPIRPRARHGRSGAAVRREPRRSGRRNCRCPAWARCRRRPAASARMVTSAPSSAIEETISTRAPRPARRMSGSASSPLAPGISTSSRMMSALHHLQRRRAPRRRCRPWRRSRNPHGRPSCATAPPARPPNRRRS